MTSRLTRPGLAAAAAAAALALSACGGTPTTAAAPTPSPVASVAASTASTPSASPAPCPSPTVAAVSTAEVPREVPADLPLPPEASVSEVKQQDGGLTVIRFSTPDSLRASILFVLDKLPANGYVLGRGDAESFEADAPFTRGELRGVMRMVATEECRTEWLLAVADGSSGGSPVVVPSYSPQPSATALPFG